MPASPCDSPPPTGTVTFLFTDIEGSTKMWEAHPEEMAVALARHDELMRAAIVDAHGFVFKTIGDAFCAAFATATDAFAAALAAQFALAAEPWPAATPIKVRMGLNTGSVEMRDNDYFGPPVNRVARIQSTGYGGQTLLSQVTFDLCRDALPDLVSLEDLGVHQLKDLARPEQIYQVRHPDLPTGFPPLKSLSNHRNNLPQQLTSFIGREKETAAIEALLDRTRLLTLVASGGSGKTRLSLQVAANRLDRFPDGAWFVELAPLTDPGLVPQAVATVLGVKEEPARPILQTLIAQLAQKQLLLVLDNCEHLVDACAKLADALIRQCPAVKILASSREALGIAGEQTFRVPSLSLPDAKTVATPRSLSEYESVRLFIERALLVRESFQVTNANAPAVASLCRHLDGIPLAIELAAARVRSLSVEEIDGKLDQRFRLLTGGSRAALPRQQTLRALIDWSYDLLQAPERLLLQRLSAFAGGWTLAAAEAVCAGGDVEDWEVFDLLTMLSDKSLVVAEQKEESTRYRLLETVRQYAREKFAESGDEATVRDRHRDHYLALAEEAEPRLMGADQAASLRLLDEEHENLRAALEWSVSGASAAAGMRICGALTRFWSRRGHFSEGRKWCERILARAAAGERTPERAKALDAAGALAWYQCDFPAARAFHEESLAIASEMGDRRAMAVALGSLASVAHEQGDFALAHDRHQESLAIMRELGDRRGIAVALSNLGGVALNQSDFAAARMLLDEGLSYARVVGDRAIIANVLFILGLSSFYLDDLPTSRKLLEESLGIWRELGDQMYTAIVLDGLGAVAHDQGEHLVAAALHRESLEIGRALDDRLILAYALEGMAEAVAALGNAGRAASIWGATERLRTELGLPLPPVGQTRYQRIVAVARAALVDDAAFERAWKEGGALPLEQAIELALA